MNLVSQISQRMFCVEKFPLSSGVLPKCQGINRTTKKKQFRGTTGHTKHMLLSALFDYCESSEQKPANPVSNKWFAISWSNMI